LSELEYLLVNGAAMQASPDLYSLLSLIVVCSFASCLIFAKFRVRTASVYSALCRSLSAFFSSSDGSSRMPTSAMPTSDFFSPPTSFVPSPHMSTLSPLSFSSFTISSFWSGETRAKIVL
jgi:hypothetical protein